MTLRQRLLLPVLLQLAAVGPIVSSVGAPLVPLIAREEGVSLDTAQWSLTATLLMGAVATVVVGRLASGRRRRPTILVVVALVCLGSALAALPLRFGFLLAGRTLQGIGFCVYPLALSLVREHLPPERHRNWMALLSLTTVTGTGLGFPIAALAAQWAGLAGAFWLTFALSLSALVFSVVAVPGSGRADTQPRVDWPGAVLIASSTFGLLLVLSRGYRWGWTSTPALGTLSLSLVALVGCVWWLLRAEDPVVDLRVAGRPGVFGANLIAVVAGAGMYVCLSLGMVLVQADPASGFGLGHSVSMSGLAMVPFAVASVLANRLSLRLAPIIGPDMLLPLGCVAFLVGNLVLATAHAHLWQAFVAMALTGIGSGLSFSAMPWLMVRFIPESETSSALSFNQVLRYLGFSAGSALSLTVVGMYDGRTGSAPGDGYAAAAGLAVLLCAVGAGTSSVMAWRMRSREAGNGSSPNLREVGRRLTPSAPTVTAPCEPSAPGTTSPTCSPPAGSGT
ncbi:MFS transporter [Nocardioides jensenii]|uniref:MFS transporter n=1 Tax=Nocardioides jensenii TaxID=1843 RepID=UPI000833BCD7|nr:MFS transporter [Nocardioides jensenii]